MEQNILQPVLNAFTRDETPANKYLGFIQEPLQVNIQGSSKKFLNRSQLQKSSILVSRIPNIFGGKSGHFH